MGEKADSEIKLVLEDGSMLVMQGDCQRTWTHEIKKEPETKGERISLTFRTVRV
jgi:alkylated DNA repair dioxygenase AlkB